MSDLETALTVQGLIAAAILTGVIFVRAWLRDYFGDDDR